MNFLFYIASTFCMNFHCCVKRLTNYVAFNERHEACDWELECLDDWRNFLNLYPSRLLLTKSMEKERMERKLNRYWSDFMVITWVLAHNENKTHNLTSLATADNNELYCSLSSIERRISGRPWTWPPSQLSFSETKFAVSPPYIVGHARRGLINFCVSLSLAHSSASPKKWSILRIFFVGSNRFSWSRKFPLFQFEAHFEVLLMQILIYIYVLVDGHRRE